MTGYRLQRVKGRRTITLFVGHDGSVTVKAPYLAAVKEIDGFVAAKEAWIKKKLLTIKTEQSMVPSLKKGSSVSILGRTFTVGVTKASAPYSDGNMLFLPEGSSGSALIGYIMPEVLSYLEIRTGCYSALYKLRFSGIKTGTAAKRWGSCSFDNVITYSVFVAFLPLKLIDYVIVHELCHTREKNHGRGFYGLLQSLMPDYREREKELKKYSAIGLYFKSGRI